MSEPLFGGSWSRNRNKLSRNPDFTMQLYEKQRRNKRSFAHFHADDDKLRGLKEQAKE